jgi:exodeoxyribonuclease X
VTVRTVDLETCGSDHEQIIKPGVSGIVEVASIDLEENGQLLAGREYLVNPGMPIPPDARGVHHISDEMVADKPKIDVIIPRAVICHPELVAFAAHNAAFEAAFLRPYLQEFRVPWICTYKCAMRQWPDAPNFKNQTLRYWLNLDIKGPTQPVHRALPDAVVTAHILKELTKHQSIETLISWSGEPPLMPRCPIGKFRGQPWGWVEAGFLSWMLRQPDMEEDLKWNARRELDRRRNVPDQPLPDVSQEAVAAEFPSERGRRQAPEEITPATNEINTLTAEKAAEEIAADTGMAATTAPADDPGAARRAYVSLCRKVIPLAATIPGLVKWWLDEADHRSDHLILEGGDPGYIDLQDACAAQYLALAKPVITALKSADALRDWWTSENQNRFDFGIVKRTQVFVDLAKLCADHKATFPANPAA